jgi:phosphoribosyl 1,2-cyclic phosphodiesterase
MRARVWGCRGSLPAPGPETVRYGGNTSCVEVRPADGRLVVIDAGTGIRELGVSMGENLPARTDILLTHLHLDHVEGLPFYPPVWQPDCEVHVWGPGSPNRSLRQSVATFFSPPLFPVHVDDLPGRVTFHDVAEEPWELGTVTALAMPVTHPGPTVGYRLEEDERVFTYISDHEPALGLDLETASPEWVSGYGLARGADVLFHDAQYTEEEYPSRVGWGHSSIAHTVQFGLLAKVRRLYLFHHDPMHGDDALEAMLARALDLWGREHHGLALTHEGMEVEIE